MENRKETGGRQRAKDECKTISRGTLEVKKDGKKGVRKNLKLLMEPFLHFHLQLKCLCNLVGTVITQICNN